ncbi:hypothetical protein AB5J52_23685 [Streptomyces sp. R39]|uniref:PH domain-containing protein n=1 Tax=Streptomyces sp. R39 TaxID=3238631 RepID=A0AB39QQS0_9ACTN
MAAQREETQTAAEWQSTVAEALQATGFTGNVVQRTIDGIGTALRLDHRADFYTKLGGTTVAIKVLMVGSTAA